MENVGPVDTLLGANRDLGERFGLIIKKLLKKL